METRGFSSPRPGFSDTKQKETPQPLMAGARIRSLVETGERRTLPSHNILHLLADRKALAVYCGAT